uniref:ATP synthase complex subunit 8 n=1 Tax=Symphurus orientalis TaxID=665865 RepID=A0A0K0Q707_9PLEU|nr:ATP synthase subunit 8 [Symphurus orientalis]
MPQLDLLPWFSILVMTWLVFLGYLLPKTMKLLSAHLPQPKQEKSTDNTFWYWPWL